MTQTPRFTAAVALAALSLAAGACRADRAVIVGVNSYPRLPALAQLDGSVNDARLIAGKLESDGFTTTILTDREATRDGVLGALAAARATGTSRERFVFYFAGHGAKLPDGNGVLLASDASPDDRSNYITKEELAAAVAAVPARSRTVLLDSCFSGAMTRGLPKSLHAKARFYNFFGVDAKKLTTVEASAKDTPTLDPAARGKICYFAACTDAQRAYEDEFDGKMDGVFTHFLAGRLRADTEAWSAVQTDVTAGVSVETEQNQSPVLSPEFAAIAIFEGPAAPPAPIQPKEENIWQFFNEDHANPALVKLDITPDFKTSILSTIAIGQKFHVQVTTGYGGGYLLLVELDTDGALDLVSPRTGKIDDAAVAPHSTLIFPTDAGKTYSVDKIGPERIRAILFGSREDAMRVLSTFDNDRIASVEAARRKHIFMAPSDKVPFQTATVGFEVVAELPAD